MEVLLPLDGEYMMRGTPLSRVPVAELSPKAPGSTLLIAYTRSLTYWLNCKL
jgi:hypothetical protein